MSKKLVELKPCPFCGGNKIQLYLVTWTDGGDNYRPEWEICCCECGGGFRVIHETEEAAIKAWNRRAKDADSN